MPRDRIGTRAGRDGRDGRDGVDGKPGERGLRGTSGDPGIDGRNGLDGAPGKQGEPGQDGTPGDLGPMPKHEWKESKLRFQQGPEGERWGEWTDLRGPPGQMLFVGGGGGGSSSDGGTAPEVIETAGVSDMVLYDETGRAILTPGGQALLAMGQ